MDALMPIVTALSLLAAVVSTTVAVRVTREQRRRRAARVAAGLDERREPSPTPDEVAVPGGLHEFMPARDHSVAAGGPVVPMAAMFGAAVPDSGSGGRQHGLLAAAAVFGVVVFAVAAAMFVGGRRPAAADTQPPLELVALGHTRTDTGLAVSGVVRNPQTAAEAPALQADVRVFDAAGILIASRQAAVDRPSLAPGEESTFSVAVGEVTTAARYRVSFSSAGALRPHVDRRTNLPAAVTADAR